MERKEMIEVLMEKAKVSYEEAEEVLQKHDWELLDSIIYLERKRKLENNETTTIIEVEQVSKEENYKKDEKKSSGLGEIIGRLFKFIRKAISKGNESNFEIRKENEKPIKISLTISVFLLIIAFWPMVILLVIGLFCGYKYSITGPNINSNRVNDILNRASESAYDIKNDFKDVYKKC